MGGFTALIVDESDDRVVVRLNRPDVRNAIDKNMVNELHRVCTSLEERPRVALIAGGDGVFAGGVDIRQLRERRRVDALAGINSGLFDRIHHLPMPTIALIDGHALGGGAELAYACDFRIGSVRARIGNPEVNLGILAAAGASWRLAALVGEPIAKEVLLAGRVLGAEEGLAIRLLNEVVAVEELDAAGARWADRIMKNAPLALQLTKRAIHAPLAAHPLIDDVAQAVLFETQEKVDRMTAFLDRHKEKKI